MSALFVLLLSACRGYDPEEECDAAATAFAESAESCLITSRGDAYAFFVGATLRGRCERVRRIRDVDDLRDVCVPFLQGLVDECGLAEDILDHREPFPNECVDQFEL